MNFDQEAPLRKILFSTPFIAAVAAVAVIDWTVILVGLAAHWWHDLAPQATLLVLGGIAVTASCVVTLLIALRVVFDRTLTLGQVFDQAYQSGFQAGRTRGLSEAVEDVKVVDLRSPTREPHQR